MVFRYQDVLIHWLGHDGFRIEHKNILVYIDPYKIESGEKGNIILITHDHFDHCSPDDIKKIASEKTVIVAPKACKTLLTALRVKEIVLIEPNQEITINQVKIRTIPAYNINKFKAPGQVFHPKNAGYVGYVITLGNVRIYHAGDTDLIPEIKELKPDIALLPVSGSYVMTADEAVKAVEEIKPKIAIPMHFDSIVGSRKDADKFKSNAKCDVIILEKK